MKKGGKASKPARATSTKPVRSAAKASDAALAFVRKRRVDGVEDYDDPTPWLAHLSLAPDERAQLIHVIRLLDPSLDEQRIMTGSFRTFAKANGVAEVPLEWWDVEDARGVRYQLWLYCADGGQLFEAGTTNSVAYVAQGAFWTKDGAPSTLGAELDAAKRAAKKAIRGSELAGVAFVPR